MAALPTVGGVRKSSIRNMSMKANIERRMAESSRRRNGIPEIDPPPPWSSIA
jgi:hypothetical protein